jgi:hypothetical protein
MEGSDSSVRGGNHADDEPSVSQAEMRNIARLWRQWRGCLMTISLL